MGLATRADYARHEARTRMERDLVAVRAGELDARAAGQRDLRARGDRVLGVKRLRLRGLRAGRAHLHAGDALRRLAIEGECCYRQTLRVSRDYGA